MASAHKRQRPILLDEERKHFEGYDFPFENLVLEGGGAKLAGGVGAVRVLEELGVLRKMKRFGGTSAGSLLATLIALGYEGHEIEEHMAVDVKKKIEDKFPLFRGSQQVYNLVRHYGIHYGASLKKWLGELIAKKMDGQHDATFWKLYEKTGKELVVTVTELMQKDCWYYHVKTTPHKPIRDAVFTSMSIPGFVCPTFTDANEDHQVFVDGGVMYNYPIHCFDGWFLSHGEENDFLKRHNDELSDEIADPLWGFEKHNEKTIGLIVYSTGEDELLRDQLEKRNQKYIMEIPEAKRPTPPASSKLRRKHLRKNPPNTTFKKHSNAQKRIERKAAAERAGPNDVATVEADNLIDEVSFNNEDAALLYGHGVDAEAAIKIYMETLNAQDDTVGADKKTANVEGDGADEQVRCPDFNRDMVTKSSGGLESIRELNISNRKYAPRRIGDIIDFLESIMHFYGNQMMRINQKQTDVMRTIGVDVDYITTRDYDMEEEDMSFLLQQSKIACLAFLAEYIATNKLTKSTTNFNVE